ncbi:hypothetical protein D3C75_657500 [compost metagenome]
MGFIGEFGYRHHWPEHFAAHDFVILLRIGQHGRFEEETIALNRLAASDQTNVWLGDGALDEAGNAVAVLRGDQRAEFGRRIILQAVLDAADGGAELLHELVVNAFLGIDAAGGGAVLAGVVETEGADAFDGGVDVGVVEDDHRGFAAQFHVHAFDGVGGAGNDVRAGGNRTGQRHHAHFRVSDQWAADGRTTAEHQVEYAGREDIRRQFSQAQGCQRSLFRRFEHHGITGGEGRGDFPGDHHQWVVPRRNGGDHAHRISADHRGVTRQVLATG